MQEYLRVGVISTTHGVRGEVKVYPTTDDPERFRELKKVILDTGKESKELAIASVKFSKNQVILKFKEYNSINEAEALKGMDLLISRADAVPLGENENYIGDLIDMSVVTDTGETLGTLTDVMKTGANDVYVVKTDQGRRFCFRPSGTVFWTSMWKRGGCWCMYWKDCWIYEFSCTDFISGYDPERISDEHYRTGG